jgi:succinate dehydrogenase / fumarate reductase, cytochrome b subunit
MHWTVDGCANHALRMVTVEQRPAVGAGRAPRRTSMQLKFVMAATGAVMLLYLVAHMVGNLKIFFGAAAIDTYAAWLREVGEPAVPHETVLWLVRVVLTVSVVAHIVSATILARRAHRARPVRYAHRKPVQGSYAARTMRWGGGIIALFVVYHLLDLTTGTLNPHGVHGEVHANVVADFAPERWYVTLFYTLAILAVGFHLRHGAFSAFRSLGQQTPRGERRARTAALIFAVLLCAGYLVVPFAVLTGLVS